MVKHIPAGEDFQFPKDFGFSGSAGPLHSVSGPGGPKPYAKGGAHKPAKTVVAVVAPHESSQPAHDPQNAVRAAMAIGAIAGAKAARSGQMAPPRFAEGGPAMDEDEPIPPSKIVPVPKPRPNPTPPHKAAGGKFLQSAVKHPGRIKAMAKREGISTAAAAEKASHSKDPSLRAAGNLGKRFISGDLSHHGPRKG